MRPIGEKSAVDIDLCSGDVGRLIGCEHRRNRGDLVGHPEPLQRRIGDEGFHPGFALCPSPNIGSQIGVRMAAGWIELQRIAHPCRAQ